MHKKNIIKLSAILGAAAVLIGAFGAHGLEDVLLEHNRVETFETGVRYQFYHVLALLFLAFLSESFDGKWLRRSALLFVLGILIFSGSLYVLSLTNLTVLGAITPIGGLCFVFGWLFMFKAVK